MFKELKNLKREGNEVMGESIDGSLNHDNLSIAKENMISHDDDMNEPCLIIWTHGLDMKYIKFWKDLLETPYDPTHE